MLTLQRMSKRRLNETNGRTDRGFTLIELIVVIVVLGVLTSIAFFSVRGVRESGVVKACNANAVTLLKAFEAYNIEKGFYPGNRQPGDNFTQDDFNALLSGGYIRNDFTRKSPDYTLTASLTTGGARILGVFHVDTNQICQAP